jgi:hypothetical protein
MLKRIRDSFFIDRINLFEYIVISIVIIMNNIRLGIFILAIGMITSGLVQNAIRKETKIGGITSGDIKTS